MTASSATICTMTTAFRALGVTMSTPGGETRRLTANDVLALVQDLERRGIVLERAA